MSDEPLKIGHEHPDVTGGWLRPAVFGAMDGLVSNFALMMGVHGGSASSSAVTIAGFAGLAAGAFSMAAGEYTSVASQSEFAAAQVQMEREELARNGDAEQAELIDMLEDLGMERGTATTAAEQIHRSPDAALRFHALHEMGVIPGEYPSALVAAASSFVSFGVGALVPLVPWMLGFTTAWPTVLVALAALFVCGAIVTRLTQQHWAVGGVRQLLLGGAAAALTYVVGNAVGSQFG